MKAPVIISIFIFISTIVLNFWMKGTDLEQKDLIGLSIGAWATAGALISASFVVYGYLINLKAFNQSQRTQILIFVDNAQVNLVETGEVVHETRINYRNISTVECEGLKIQAHLVCASESVEIPRLFKPSTNLQVGDSRVRNFPTLVYLKNNGIPQQIIDNISKYNLRISYTFTSLGESIQREYDYEWNQQMNVWNIT
jgi:hypothetical protein